MTVRKPGSNYRKVRYLAFPYFLILWLDGNLKTFFRYKEYRRF